MSEWIWIIANACLGLPLAAFTLVCARETVRSLVALALGFRVFEIQLGAGRWRATRAVGPLDLTLAPWPIAGATAARAGSPRRHRLARVLLAISPSLAQSTWLLVRLATGNPPGATPLVDGPAPLACVDLANALLLLAHLSLAIEFGPGVRSDVRLLLDALVTRPETGRLARANYYARLARQRLDRADPEGARDALERGRRQLGPAPVLEVCERELTAHDLDSIVGCSDCAQRIRLAIEDHEPRRRDERAAWSPGERLRQRACSAIPLIVAIAALGVVQAEAALRRAERGLHALGQTAASSDDAEQCQRLTDTWSAWTARVDPWLPPSDSLRSERHRSLAILADCRGDGRRLRTHQGEALLAAQSATRQDVASTDTDPDQWWADTLRVATLLRETAEVAGREARHRDALRTLHQAERRLGTAETRLALLTEGPARHRAETALAEERSAIQAARERILATLGAS